MYRVYLQDGKIVGKESYGHFVIETQEDIDFAENAMFVRPEIIENVDLPATPIWEDYKIVGAVSLPKQEPEPQPPEPTTEKILLQALLEIQELKQKIVELEGE